MSRTIFLSGPADPQFQEFGTTKVDDNGLLRHELNLQGILKRAIRKMLLRT